MDRIFAWIVDRLRWLFLGTVLLGGVFVYLGWTASNRIRLVAANGIETTARIDGATITKGRRGSESYTLKLSWSDAGGNARTAGGVSISNALARRITSGNRITSDRVRIKYLADASVDSVPIVLDDDPAGQAESDDLLAAVGIGMVGGGAVGSVVIFLLSRRRRASAASPQPQVR
jgi:hypothetical protein